MRIMTSRLHNSRRSADRTRNGDINLEGHIMSSNSNSNTASASEPDRKGPSAGSTLFRGLLWGVAMGVGLAIGGPVGAVVVAVASNQGGGSGGSA